MKVWQKAMEVTTLIYQTCSEFPKEEKYGLTSQIQRSAISIPSNIAEGCGRISKNEFKQFLSIAIASSYELETQITLANNIKYISLEKHNILINNIQEIQKMISGLYNSINS